MSFLFGIPETIPQPCHICESKESVQSRQVEVFISGARKTAMIGAWCQSNLCKVCKENGWLLLNDEENGKLVYKNHKTKEIKNV